jgi:D-amino-acid dehydrogenase
MRLFRELLDSEGIECEWKEAGLLFVHTDARTMEHYAATNDYLTRQFGVAARRYDPAELVKLEPALREDVAGAWYFEGDAYLRPDLFLPGLKKALERQGVAIVEGRTVERIIVESGMARGVTTGDGDMDADYVVVATGAVAPRLARDVALRLHIQPGKGYSLTTTKPKLAPRIPMILEDHSVAVASYDGAFRLASTMEFGGYNEELNSRRLGLLEEGARHYLREVRGELVEDEWYGWRPMTDTGIPIIGPAPRVPNAYIAAGHSMLGISMAPGTGRLIAELISGSDPHVDAEPYAPR